MNLQDTESLLKLMRTHGVNYFKSSEVEIKIDLAPSVNAPIVGEPPRGDDYAPKIINNPPSSKSPEHAAAAPPVEMEIPHHVNEVANLLKLSDEELVDKMFPDYTQGVNNAEG